MAHKPYSLHKRPRKKGKAIIYCQFYDESGRRMPAISTGCTAKGAAEDWAIDYINQGKVGTSHTLSFSQYAENFFDWEKCDYIKSQIARGENISHNYADALRSYLQNHILPYFKHYKMMKITPKIIETWLMGLRDKPGKTGVKLSPATINQCLNALRIMLNEAARLGIIPQNPSLSIKQLKKETRTKGILTYAETKALFDETTIETIWNNDLVGYTANLLAASTGMRLGEIQALKIKNVFDDYIKIEYSFAKKYGLKEPKRGSFRSVPMPEKTARYLKKLIAQTPFKEPEDLLFYRKDRDTPIDGKLLDTGLYSALERIKITPEERKARNVTFHSWRYFFNSFMRTRIPDAKLQHMTGHKSTEMTDHYTHFSTDDFKDVVLIQQEMV